MASYSRLMLSGSTNGRGIKVGAGSTPGTTIHTAVSGTVNIDEIYLWAQNNTTTAVELTIEFGGVSSPDDLIIQTIPPKSGLYAIVPGLNLQNGLVVKAFAGTVDVIEIFGYVNRITQ